MAGGKRYRKDLRKGSMKGNEKHLEGIKEKKKADRNESRDRWERWMREKKDDKERVGQGRGRTKRRESHGVLKIGRRARN